MLQMVISMADEADNAQDAESIYLQAALDARKPVIKVENSGFCLNCLEAVYHGNYCDAE